MKELKNKSDFYLSVGTIVMAIIAVVLYVIADLTETALNNDVPLQVSLCILVAIVVEVLTILKPKMDFGKIVSPLAYALALCLAIVNRVDYVIQIASHNNQVSLQMTIILSVVLLLLCVIVCVASAFRK